MKKEYHTSQSDSIQISSTVVLRRLRNKFLTVDTIHHREQSSLLECLDLVLDHAEGRRHL
jgi:hypothetical protein